MIIILYRLVETSLMFMEKINQQGVKKQVRKEKLLDADREKMTEISCEKQVDRFEASKEAASVEHCHPG